MKMLPTQNVVTATLFDILITTRMRSLSVCVDDRYVPFNMFQKKKKFRFLFYETDKVYPTMCF